MKRTKRLSFLMAMIITIANVVFISIPSVGAEGSEFIVSDDFETGYTAISSNAAATLSSMQEVCDMAPWWYSVRANADGTVFNKAEDIKAGTEDKPGTPLIASVVNAGDNNVMRITYHASAGVGTNIVDPAKANMYVYGNESYEVSFKFYATKNMQILGIGGKQENGTATFYHHNILKKEGNAAYMGDTESSSPASPVGEGISSNKWYTLKLNVNNDIGNYSVEILDANGTSLQRVGGINFKDGCPGISNIRFQALTADSVVYIDDYTAKKIARDNLLFEDDFNIYSELSGTKTAGANVFKEISQFRVLDTASVFGLGGSDDKYFMLDTPASAVYMPWNGHILTKESQAVRGKLQMTFSFCIDDTTNPTKTAASFRVICADNYTSVGNLGNAKYTMFRVQPFLSGGKIVYGAQKSDAANDEISSYEQIYKGTWYDVQLTFDLINDKVSMVGTENGATKFKLERSTSLYNDGTPLESIKSIAFRANDGMVIDIDNVELKYVPEEEVVEELKLGTVRVKDFNGERVTDVNSVNPALSSIEIPFSGAVTDESVKNIKIMTQDRQIFTGYTTTNVNGVYTMNFTKTLAPNTTYGLVIPATVESEKGAALSNPKTFALTTGSGNGAEMVIADVSVKTVEEITNGSTISITTKYANTKDTTADCMAIVAYYDKDNRMIGSSSISSSIPANSVKMSFVAPVNVPVAAALDMSKVNKVSVYLWDSYGNIRPYCESVDIFRTTADSE